MYKYHCAVTPTDELVAYVTDSEKEGIELFSLVMTNIKQDKISVLLDKHEATRLYVQLGQYIGVKP